MNRKAYASILAFICLALGFLTSCSSSSSTPPPPTIAIAATSGATQNCAVGTAFPQACSQPLVATVTSNGSPSSGVSVTFTAPSSGASGTFADGGTPAATDTETTDANGNATSTLFTANSTTGADVVTATTSGASTPASFNLTNDAANTYAFYLSGQEAGSGANAGFIFYYAIAGAVTIDASGNVLGGEEDYNDGFAITSPGEPTTPDTISAASGAMVVDPTTGVGTLTLTSSNTNVGVAGVETFAVQFVNANHALISQFDGSATSSGSLDLQTLPSGGNFAFAMTGVNPSYDSVAFGGVYTASSGTVTGTMDVNDFDGGVLTAQPISATLAGTDSFGRTVVTGVTNPSYAALGVPAPINLVSYAVGPEAYRIIDVDATDSAVGSAFGQGTNGTAATTGSLGSSVFTVIGQWSTVYASLGQFGTDGDGDITAGLADDNELDNEVQAEGAAITGSYTVAANGYGGMSIIGDGDVATMGLYLTDPLLNLNDPNNTVTDVGGALVVELDADLPGGMGVITPQTDTTATDFTNNPNPAYAAGFQNINDFDVSDGELVCVDCELDMVGPFTMTAGLLSTATIGADDSDPFGTWDGTPAESSGDTFTSTPLAVVPGYFSMSQDNVPANPLAATINAVGPGTFDADIYQASATTLYWLEWDDNGVFLGPIEQQGSLATIPALKRPGAKARSQKGAQVIKGLGGQIR
jgi:hypothetical protein